jgi:hypothetical protein
MIVLSDKDNNVYRSIWKIEGRWLIHRIISYDQKREREHQWWIPYFIGMSTLCIIGVILLYMELT